MEGYLKQMRVRFSGTEQGNKDDNIKRTTIPPKKSQSFKGEKKQSQNWFRRQFSRQMSQDYDSNKGVDYTAAVAAAAFAVKSLEESNIQDQKKPSQGPAGASMTKIKSKSEDTTGKSGSRTLSRRFLDEDALKNFEVPDNKVPATRATNGKMPGKSVGPAPSIKKAPTFADKQLAIIDSEKPKSRVPKPEPPSAKQSTFPPAEARRQSSTKPGTNDTEADAWERTEMAKIKEKYEKLLAEFRTWEDNRKKKAKSRLDKTEAAIDRRRYNARRNYSSKIESIDKIVVGVKAHADENRRNEEFKVKERANKIRSTGKFPTTCFCF